jgi:uncharacterized membrane protein
LAGKSIRSRGVILGAQNTGISPTGTHQNEVFAEETVGTGGGGANVTRWALMAMASSIATLSAGLSPRRECILIVRWLAQRSHHPVEYPFTTCSADFAFSPSDARAKGGLPFVWVLLLIAALNLAAALISLALLRSGLKGHPIPGCGARSGCDAVQKSRWARLGPVPVAALGTGLYLVLSLTVLARFIVPAGTGFSLWILMIGALFAGGGALWFTLLQLLVIRKFCHLCMIIHGLATAACVLTVFHLYTQSPHALGMAPISVGIGGVLVLAFLQIVVSPRAYVSIPAADLPPATTADLNPPAPDQASSSSSLSPAFPGPTVKLVDGKITLAMEDWPLLGFPRASRVVAVMFDVTCDECRHLYRLLQQTVEQFPRQVAFLTLPVPLHPACNPAACGKLSEDAYACEFAKLYLALWQMNPTAFADFSRWLTAAKRPPAFSEARNRAQRSMTASVSLALVDTHVLRRLDSAVDLYRRLRVDLLPQLLLEDRMILGRLDSLKELRAVLQLDKAPKAAPTDPENDITMRNTYS